MAFGLSHLVQMSEFSIKNYLIDLCLQTPLWHLLKRAEKGREKSVAFSTQAKSSIHSQIQKYSANSTTSRYHSNWHFPWILYIPFVLSIRDIIYNLFYNNVF